MYVKCVLKEYVKNNCYARVRSLTAIVAAEKQKLEQVPGGARIPPAGAIS